MSILLKLNTGRRFTDPHTGKNLMSPGWTDVGVGGAWGDVCGGALPHVLSDPAERVFTREGHQSVLSVRDGSHTVECG